jgi:hypothetical protein
MEDLRQIFFLIKTTMKYATLKMKRTANIRKAGRKPKGALARKSETYTKKIMSEENAATPGISPLSRSSSACLRSSSRSCLSAIVVNSSPTRERSAPTNTQIATFLRKTALRTEQTRMGRS